MTPDEAELPALLAQWMRAWNSRDLDALMQAFREDAVLSTPSSSNSGDGVESNWLSGHDEIRTHFAHLSRQEATIEDVFIGRQFYSILITSGGQRVIAHVEPDESSNKIRRLIVCYSAGGRERP